MPPLVAAIGRLVEPDLDGLSTEFREAWAHAPAVAQAYVDGEHYAINATNRYNVVSAMAERRIAERGRAENEPVQRAAKAIDLLNSTDPDCLTRIELTYGDPAFFVGLTLGLHRTAVLPPQSHWDVADLSRPPRE